MKNRWKKTAALVMIAVLVMSLGAIAAFAQDEPTPETPALPFGRGGFHGGFHRNFDGGFHGRGHFGGANDEALAEALGITVEELQAARQKVAADRLAQAVEDGYLTQDQANLMLAMQVLKGELDHQAIMAEALGMTPEELAAAREDGTLREKLNETTMAELHEKMQVAMQAAVQQAVADNLITQEQADLLLEHWANGLDMHGGYHGFGGRGGGYHGHHGMPRGDMNGAFSPFRNMQTAPSFGA